MSSDAYEAWFVQWPKQGRANPEGGTDSRWIDPCAILYFRINDQDRINEVEPDGSINDVARQANSTRRCDASPNFMAFVHLMQKTEHGFELAERYLQGKHCENNHKIFDNEGQPIEGTLFCWPKLFVTQPGTYYLRVVLTEFRTVSSQPGEPTEAAVVLKTIDSPLFHVHRLKAWKQPPQTELAYHISKHGFKRIGGPKPKQPMTAGHDDSPDPLREAIRRTCPYRRPHTPLPHQVQDQAPYGNSTVDFGFNWFHDENRMPPSVSSRQPNQGTEPYSALSRQNSTRSNSVHQTGYSQNYETLTSRSRIPSTNSIYSPSTIIDRHNFSSPVASPGADTLDFEWQRSVIPPHSRQSFETGSPLYVPERSQSPESQPRNYRDRSGGVSPSRPNGPWLCTFHPQVDTMSAPTASLPAISSIGLPGLDAYAYNRSNRGLQGKGAQLSPKSSQGFGRI